MEVSIAVKVTCASAPVGKMGGAPLAGSKSLRIPWVTQGKVVPLHGVHLVEVIWPFPEQMTL